MVKKIINNPWLVFSAWVLTVFGFFKLDAYMITGAIFKNMAEYPWKETVEWSLIGGAFWFGVHAYYRSTKYINERKDILDNILRLLMCASQNEADLKKLFEVLDKPDYKAMLSKALNINTNT